MRLRFAFPVLSLALGLAACGSAKTVTPVKPSATSSADAAITSSAQIASTSPVSGPAAVSPATGAAGGSFACASTTSCPAALLDYIGSFNATGTLVGTVGTSVTWSFSGVDHNTYSSTSGLSTRAVVVLFDGIPPGSVIAPAMDSGTLSQKATVTWTPTTPQTGTLSVITRDYDRCVIEQSADFCNQYSLLTDYDKEYAKVPWQITNAVTAAGSGTVASTGSGSGTSAAPAAVAAPAPTTTSTTTTTTTKTPTTPAPTTTTTTTSTLPAVTFAPAPAPTPAVSSASNCQTASGGLFGSLIGGLTSLLSCGL